MRKSYGKHYSLAIQGKIGVDPDPPHHTALFGALSTRNRVCGFPNNETIIWLELSPFLQMEEHESIESLCDYAVYRELVDKIEATNYQKLVSAINRGLLKVIKNEPNRLKGLLMFKVKIPWMDLLIEETISKVDS